MSDKFIAQNKDILPNMEIIKVLEKVGIKARLSERTSPLEGGGVVDTGREVLSRIHLLIQSLPSTIASWSSIQGLDCVKLSLLFMPGRI